jgi:uncharacterized repeat protein (TIGR01451 family)
VDVPAETTPSISVVKTAAPTSFSAPGTTITYTYVVQNTGNVTMDLVSLSDNKLGAVTNCTPALSPLAPGATSTCTATHVTTQSDVDAGGITNTATATGQPPTGPPETDTSSADVGATTTPSINVVKTAAPASFNAPGQTITYTYVVTNAGNVTLNPVTLDDNNLGPITSCTQALSPLAPGGTTTCTATHVTTQSDVDAGGIVNSATATGDPPSGPPQTDTSTADVGATTTPGISVVKSASPSAFNQPGQTITYTYVIINTGNVTLNPVTLSDNVLGTISSCSPPLGSLAPGGAITCTATHMTTQADIDAGGITNTATATGYPPTGPPETDTSLVDVPAETTPSISVVKSASPGSFSAVGQTITYTYVITNTGNVTLSSVSLNDDKLGTITSCNPVLGSLVPGASTTCTATHVTTLADLDAGGITNTATATGDPPSGPPETSPPSTVDVPAEVAPGIRVDKTAAPTTFDGSGQTITYTYVITNTGNVTLNPVSLSDNKLGPITTCPTGPPGSLAPGGTITCTATHVTTQADVDAGGITNIATVTGQPPTGPPETDTSTVNVPAQTAPGIGVVKSAAPTTFDAAGQTITYTYVITNTGNVTLNPVTLSDNKLGPITSCTPALGSLAPGRTTTCTATHLTTQADVDAGGITNTATATGQPPTGPTETGTSTADVGAVPRPGISVVKTAIPSTFDGPGQTITYTYVVTNTGNVTLDPVSLIDDKLGAITSCTPVLSPLAPGATSTCTATHVTTQGDVDAGGVTNAATATGDPPTGPPETSPPSTVDVPAETAPGIGVVKSASPATFSAPGTTITYTYVVTNTGNVTLDPVSLSDDKLGAITSCTPALSPLAPGATSTCTATYVTTQGDVDAGGITNAATASGDPPIGPPETSPPSTVDVPAVNNPGISVVKSASPNSFDAVGQTITYTYVITNTGNVTLSSVSLSDNVLGSITSCTPALIQLPPGGTISCTASHVTTLADLDAGGITNTATATGDPPNGPPETSPPSTVDVPAEVTPGIEVHKSASPTSFDAPGQTITYTYVITNTGNVTLNPVTLSDDKLGTITNCTPALSPLAPGATSTCTAMHVTTQADVDAGGVTNAATATGQPPTGPPETSPPSRVDVPAENNPGIGVVKTAAPTTFDAAGQTITYTYVITNTGNVTLSAVSLSDDRLGPITNCTPALGPLAPGGTITCTATHVTTQGDVDAGGITNTATATGQPPTGPPETSPPSTVDVPAENNPGIGVVKTAVPASFSAPGQTITYTYVITNTGNVTLSAVSLSDDKLGPITSCTPALGSLTPGATTTCTASHVTTQGDVDAGGIVNSATATGQPPTGPPEADTSTVDVPAVTDPAISVAKTASPASFGAPGQTITYTYVVKNAGNVTMDPVTLTDTKLGAITSCTPALSPLAPGATSTCTATHVTTQGDVDGGSIANTATVTAQPPTGPPETDTSTVTILGPPPNPAISVVKTADPSSFDAAGQTITYTYMVQNTGNVTMEPVTLEDNQLGAITSCTPALSPLAPGATSTCTATHVTTQGDVDAGGIVNTATVTGQPPTGPPKEDTSTVDEVAPPRPAISLLKSASQKAFTAAGQTITYTYVVTNTGNVTLTPVVVTDPLPGLSTIACPSAVVTLAPGGTVTCKATYTTTQADVSHGSIPNTGTATGTPPSGPDAKDSSTVTVPLAAISVTKSANPDGFTQVGQTVTYTYTVKNTGGAPLTTVGVTDPAPGLSAITCPTTTLAPGASVTCTATHTVTQDDVNNGSITNTGTATGTDPDGDAVSGTSTITIKALPAIALVKSASPSMFTAAGQTITYTFKVSNTGAVPLNNVAITDVLPGLSSIMCPGTTLSIGASMTCTASYTTTAADVARGTLANTATATASSPNGDPSPSTSTSLIPAVVQPPAPTPGSPAAPAVPAASVSPITPKQVQVTG